MTRREFDLVEEIIQAAISRDEGAVEDLPADAISEELDGLTSLISALSELGGEEATVESQNLSRTRTLSAAAALRESQPPRSLILPNILRPIAVTAVMFTLVFLTGFGLIQVSAESIPGDVLYPIKRSAESLTSAVSRIRADSPKQTLDLNQRRIDEIHELLTLGRVADIQFDGVIEEIIDGVYIITGFPVHTDDTTLQIGIPQVEQRVRVLGTTTSNSIIAAKAVLPLRLEVTGPVEQLGQSVWVVAGIKFNIDDLKPDWLIQVGDWVVVVLELDDGHQYIAESVSLIQKPTPSPTKLPVIPDDADETQEPDDDHEFDDETEEVDEQEEDKGEEDSEDEKEEDKTEETNEVDEEEEEDEEEDKE